MGEQQPPKAAQELPPAVATGATPPTRQMCEHYGRTATTEGSQKPPAAAAPLRATNRGDSTGENAEGSQRPPAAARPPRDTNNSGYRGDSTSVNFAALRSDATETAGSGMTQTVVRNGRIAAVGTATCSGATSSDGRTARKQEEFAAVGSELQKEDGGENCKGLGREKGVEGKCPKLPSNPPFINPQFFTPHILELLQSNPDTCLNSSNTPKQAHIAQEPSENNRQWIFDCGATDTMTYDPTDFKSHTQPTKQYIQTANGGLASVEGAGHVEISPSLKLSNCLFVPSLSCKLLSISHVTKELNCTVLMHPHFCLLQDIRMKEIIGRGTERRGLYYVDEVAQQGSTMLTHGTVDRQMWL